MSLPFGQLICPTLVSGTRPFDPDAQLALLRRHGWGGYIAFHRPHLELAETLARFRREAPLLIGADMEHGAGQQALGLSTFPTAMAFGATGDPALAYDLGAWTAREALGVGVDWIFAPVADVTNNPFNPIINIRSFGRAPAPYVEAFTRGVQDQGALACAKHFPGHGDTVTDSHTRLGSVQADRARLEAVELPPFRAAIAAHVGSIMTAHLALPALGVPGPATTSRAVMTSLLREALGFDGLVVTDALVMGGITAALDPLDAAVDAVAAGCDMLLMPPDPVATVAALEAAVRDGRLSKARVLEAAGRVAAARARVGKAGAAPSRSAAALADEVARRAVTLARGEVRALPAGTPVITIDDGAEPARIAAWKAAVERFGFVNAEDDDVEAPLVAVFAPIRVSKDRSLLPRELVERLRGLSARTPVVLASFSSPFLVAQVPEAAAWVLAYGTGDPAQAAVLAALKAGGPFPGTCPVDLPAALEGVEGEIRSYGGPSFT